MNSNIHKTAIHGKISSWNHQHTISMLSGCYNHVHK